MLLIGLGCSGATPGPTPPAWEPELQSQRAMEMYDGDGDGRIAKKEFDACPGLLDALEVCDADGDGALSRQELAERIGRFQRQGFALQQFIVRVTLDGVPLGGALVVLRPEEFLGSVIQQGEGTTAADGLAVISSKFAASNGDGLLAVQPGIYRIEVTQQGPNGQERIPARYHEKSELGIDLGTGHHTHGDFHIAISSKK